MGSQTVFCSLLTLSFPSTSFSSFSFFCHNITSSTQISYRNGTLWNNLHKNTNTAFLQFSSTFVPKNAELHSDKPSATAAPTSENQLTRRGAISLSPDATFSCSICDSMIGTCGAAAAKGQNESRLPEFCCWTSS